MSNRKEVTGVPLKRSVRPSRGHPSPLRILPSLRTPHAGMLLLLYLAACSVFNLLCGRALNLGEFAIRTQDLLWFVQLPGLIISGSAFLLAVLRKRRGGLWDVTGVLTVISAVLGIVLVILMVAVHGVPSPFRNIHLKKAWFLRHSWRAYPSFYDYLDIFPIFALAVLDTWFCLAWVGLLRWSRGGKGEP